MPGKFQVVGVLCALALGFCAVASTAAGAARPGEQPVTVIDNFHSGRSRTAATGSEPSLLGAGADRSPLAALTPAEAGPRKVAVLLVAVPGQSFQPGWSAAEARSKVFTASNSANAFYAEESYGEISLTGKLRPDGDVFGPFSVSPKAGGCAYEEWDDEADQAAANAGVDLSGYGSIVYDTPLQLSCNWSGIADLGGSRVNINGNPPQGVVAHELGHNLGLEHAGSWTCTEGGVRVQISDTCTVTEYGDPFDTMGDAKANRHNSGFNLAKLGILGPQNIETVTESGTYSFRSAATKTNQPTVLRIARKRSPSHFVTSWYYLEIRQSVGVFESGSDAAMTGVSIRATAPEGSSPETLLLDANPATGSFNDAPLQPGETFDGGRVQIKTISAGAGQATVEVQLKTQPPAAPEGLQASVSADGVQLEWNDADSAEVKNYFVYRDGEQVGNVFSREYLDFRPLAGEHEYTVVAQDEEENRSDPSPPLTVDVPVVSGPTCAAGKCKTSYLYSGAPATWTVPLGVSAARVTADGARGGGRFTAPERGGAAGARIWATLGPLTPGQEAEISVGGKGEKYSEGGAGGFNGGGDGGRGGGGGGFTKLELESTLWVLAAGGAGGGMDGHNGTLLVMGGRAGEGSMQGDPGTRGAQTLAMGATLKGGGGGAAGGGGGGGGEGGPIVGSTTCEGGTVAGVAGGSGGDLNGGGGVAEAGGGGGGGYVGGGQGGGGAHDACGDFGASGGGGGGSSFVAPGHLESSENAGEGNGWLAIEYDDPVTAPAGEYTTLGDQELDVPADQGVLAGASGPEPGGLTASLVDPPAAGSLSLEADGSFTYVPDPGFLGADSFVVRVAGAAAEYAETTVTINVAGPPSAAVSSPLPAGTYVVGEAVATAFSCSEGTGGPGLLSCADSNGATGVAGGVGQLDTATEGDHTYTVTALSKDGLSSSSSIDYEVVPAASEPPSETPDGTPPPGGSPATPPSGPAPPGGSGATAPEVGLSPAGAKDSLRALLRTGRLHLRVSLGGAAKLAISGQAKLRSGSGRSARTKLVAVFAPKSVLFAAAGERTVTLVLTGRGRKALEHLSGVRLVVTVEATGASGEATRKSLPLRLGA